MHPKTKDSSIQQINFVNVTFHSATMADPFDSNKDTQFLEVFNSMMKLFQI